ncbi:hypothetical protein J2S89_002315 [Arthrobacter bambusae]|nr:hypothetical protein [Arthrobacter bambusae]MDQ0098406.1 hypothetical protein [Arthrobacter bambusae]
MGVEPEAGWRANREQAVSGAGAQRSDVRFCSIIRMDLIRSRGISGTGPLTRRMIQQNPTGSAAFPAGVRAESAEPLDKRRLDGAEYPVPEDFRDGLHFLGLFFSLRLRRGQDDSPESSGASSRERRARAIYARKHGRLEHFRLAVDTVH